MRQKRWIIIWRWTQRSVLLLSTPTLSVATKGTLYGSVSPARRSAATHSQAWFELKRELHRRFTPEQKLGNVFAMTWHGLTLRPGPRTFLEQGMERAVGLTAEASPPWAEFARTLADGTFGPVTPNGRFVTSN